MKMITSFLTAAIVVLACGARADETDRFVVRGEASKVLMEQNQINVATAEAIRQRRSRSLTPIPLAPAVIPLVHAPDDPGPEAESHIDPPPEPADEASTASWTRIRQLFKP